jgi:cysteine synthase
MPAYAVNSMLDLIGGTPLVRLRQLVDASMADVFCKCEQFNPGGSLKDRVALSMIEAAEREGKIAPGESVIIEPTSGNTGVGLALVSAAKRYRLILTMPDNMSLERRALLKAYGAELHLTPAAAVMRGAVERAQELARDYPHAFMPQQFNNPANVAAHYRTTGPEIVAQLGNRSPDAFVHGVGTGGTITGVGEVLKERNPGLQVVAVEPKSSAILSGGRPGPHKIQGIGAGFVPRVLNLEVIDEIVAVDDEDAIETARLCSLREGVLAGISGGAAVWAAIQVGSRPEHHGKRVVVIVPDSGERYVSTPFFAP